MVSVWVAVAVEADDEVVAVRREDSGAGIVVYAQSIVERFQLCSSENSGP